MTLRYSLAACAVVALTLTACDNSTDGETGSINPPGPITQVPTSAGVSSAAYTAFVVAQVATSSETSEPLGTDNVSIAPTSETDEPVTVN